MWPKITYIWLKLIEQSLVIKWVEEYIILLNEWKSKFKAAKVSAVFLKFL